MKFKIRAFFRKTVKEIQVSLKSDKKTGTLHTDHYTFFIIAPSNLFRMKNVSDKSCRGNQNTHFVFNNFFFFSSFFSKIVKFMR
jgi:hypothetical protein